MKNLFTVANYPSAEPDELVVGERWAWRRPDVTAVYPTADYTLRYRIALLSDPFSAYQFDAGKVSAEHVVELDNATTADYAPGEYAWRASIVRDSDSAEIELTKGVFTVATALDAEGGDARSFNYRVLAAIRATIEGTASEEQSRIEISGRILENRPISELLVLEREFSKRWNREKDAILRKAGRSTGRRVLVSLRG